MAEIKNTFSQGKMNKDLDERLIPNGQYRDALNVEITSDGESAETGSAGTISNIKGNIPLENVVPSDKCVCVGSVADEKNNKLYWFIKCQGFPQVGDTAFPNRDAIIEYDTVSKESTFLITDLRSTYTNSLGSTVKPILNFSGKKITAISIIDQYLVWSDGETEPKKINIEKAREATIKENKGINGRGSISHHSYLYVDGIGTGQYLQEENITVIKKKPLSAPRYSIVSAKNKQYDPNLSPILRKEAIFEKIFPRFCLRYKYQDGEYSAFGPWTNVIFNPEFVGDYSVINAYTAKEPYNAAMVNTISKINFYGLVTPDMPKDVVQIDILYKQENSTVVHNVGSIKNTDSEWFEDGNWFKLEGLANYDAYNPTTKGVFTVDTENIHAALPENQFLRVWDAVPRKAQAQEVIGNRLVFANYTEGYDMVFNNSDFKPKVLGSFEPRQVEAEIFRDTGAFGTSFNLSVLEGTYVQTLETYATPGVEEENDAVSSYVYVNTIDPSSPLSYSYAGYRGAGLPTLKSQRDYQLGVVFGDEYGRETPVFTSDLATIKVPWEGTYGKSASTSLSITASLGNTPPSWASYYKFYIKQSSGEYHNMVMDKIYRPALSYPDDDKNLDHVWASFASSDRNKVEVGDFITIKKIVNQLATQIEKENKYKILDISNEMPESIAYEYNNLGNFDNVGDSLTDEETGSNNPIFPSNPASNEDSRIDRITDTIEIDKINWLNRGGSALTKEAIDDYTEFNPDIYISWKRKTSNASVHSNRYKVTSVTFKSNKYLLKLSSFIKEEDAKIAANNSSDLTVASAVLGGSLTTDLLTFRVEKKQKKTKESFDGRFFIKIASDYVLQTYLLSEFSETNTDYYIGGSQKLFYLADEAVTDYNAQNGIVNSENSGEITSYHDDADVSSPSDIHSGGSLTNLKSEWQSLMDDPNFGWRKTGSSSASGNGGFFIDAMYFAAVNSDQQNYYAKYSGQGWTGNPRTYYPEIEWGRVIDYNTSDTDAPDLESPFNNWLTFIPPTSYGRDYNVSAKRVRYGWRKKGSVDADINNWIESTNVSDSGGFRRKYRNWNHGNFSTWKVLESTPDTVVQDRESEVNGFEGILEQAKPVHYNSPTNGGYRTFLTNIYGQQPTGRTQPKTTYTSNLAGTQPSYMHFSFLGPGYEGSLFDPSQVPTTVGLYGENAIGNYLQGIWGGGAFTNEAGTNFGLSNIRFVEMEGSLHLDQKPYTSDGVLKPTALGDANSEELTAPSTLERSIPPHENAPNVYFGYNKTDGNEARHKNQWLPGGDPNGDAKDIYNFVQANMVSGKKFRFKNDDSKEIYTILDVATRYVYNHTPWKARKIWNGTEYVWGNDSVEEAVAAWADTADADGNPDNSGNEFAAMLQRLEDFGDRSNRRTTYVLALDKPVQGKSYNPVLGADTQGSQVLPDAQAFSDIEFVYDNPMVLTGEVLKDPAVWETEPKNNDELDVYYEASNAIPTKLNKNNLDLFAPQGTRIEFPNMDNNVIKHDYDVYLRRWNGPMSSYNDEVIQLEVRALSGGDTGFKWFSGDTNIDYGNQEVRFYRQDGSYTTATTANVQIEQFYIDSNNMTNGDGDYWKAKNTAAYIFIKNIIDPTKQVGLNWFNAFTFTDGVESNRIRDDFNEMTISNGARVSTTLDEPYKEEVKKNSLIYSGIYNSNSKQNSLNEFITAEKITKDLNPTYGSIQKLFTRNSDLIAFCEDRVVKILGNKDALYNADGNPQLIASNRVLGQATPFVGDFGISKNPESFAKDSYRAYFADKQRGAVLRLSMDGLTPISEAGMGDWFKDELTVNGVNIIGSFDDDAREYNLTIKEIIQDNKIQNNTFDYGSESSLVNIVNQEICRNPNMSGGAEYTPVDLANDIYYGGPGADSSLGVSLGFKIYPKAPIRNRSIGYTSIVRNWPAIPQGSIRSAAAGVDPIPSSDIPAWAEVIHEVAGTDVWSITSGTGNRFYKGEQVLGVMNPGQWETSVDNNGNTVEWYNFVQGNDLIVNPIYDNAVEGENSYTGLTPTTYITTPSGSALQPFNQYTEASTVNGVIPADNNRGVLIQNNGSTEGSFYFQQALNNNSKYVVGNWYCVDVYLDSSYSNNALNNLLIPGVLGAGSGLDSAYGTDHTQNNPGYPPYHFGKIGGSATAGFNKSIVLMPVTNNEWPLGSGQEVYRAIFQYNAPEDVQAAQGQNFILQAWNADCLVNLIMLYDITEQATMTKPTNWNVIDDAWVSEHAMHEFITAQTNYNLEPECYFRHNMLCWNTQRASHVYWRDGHYSGSGLLDSTEESYSGYLLNFTIENNPDFDTFEGKLRIRVTNRWDDQNNSLDGAYIRNIDIPGDYSILMNFNSVDPTIISAPEGSEVYGVAFANQNDYSQTEGHRSNITIFPENGGCTGSLSSISLIDATQYYEGGGVDSWAITGYDRSAFDYISWNEENLNLVFNQAPITQQDINTGVESKVQVEQRVGNIESNSNVTLGFSLTELTGSIKVYYYNSFNKGFSLVFDSSGVVSTNVLLNQDRPGDALINTLVISANEDNTSCAIDDIVLFKRADQGFKPKTVSYSEEVKGWTSLKSFHPESGLSVARQYYTINNGELWQHHANEVRNNFYGNQYDSHVTFVMNSEPSTVKNFRAFSYEGTQAKVHESQQQLLGQDENGNNVYASSADNYNYSSKQGWFAEDIHTDIQHGSIKEFIKKEGKWFNNIKGKNTGDSVTIEEVGSFSFQGLGFVSSIEPSVDIAPVE